jgi:mRNA-degrading endonuclease RelE of RelBE toxin-antitoxin system
MASHFRLLYSETCRKQIRNLPPQIKPAIKSRIEEVAVNPLMGKFLERELSGYLSFRFHRYRVIYRVNESDGVVEIHFVGHRRDIYELFGEHLQTLSPGGE